MIMRILSLDISSQSTGWAFMFGAARGLPTYGLIKTNSKFPLPERLAFFREELIKILREYRPTHVVIEDVYSGVNSKVTVVLSEFRGVAEECIFSTAGIEPYIIHTNTVKAYFKAKSKEDIFDIICDIYDWPDADFKKHNDITDSIAMLLCYYDQTLKYRKFKFEKDYGYIYEV